MSLLDTFVTIKCYLCATPFGMETSLYNQRCKDRRGFFCPVGHEQYFSGPTPDQKRIADLEAEVAKQKAETLRQQRVAEADREARRWAESAVHGARVMRGRAEAAKKRLEHRVNCGVCPHCKRTFKQLAAHMKSKHPEKK